MAFKKLTAPKVKKAAKPKLTKEQKVAKRQEIVAAERALREARRPGHPTDYRPEFASRAKDMCSLGATMSELAAQFAVDQDTIYAWMTAHREFSDALKLGRDEADARVEHSLYHRALGYSREAVKIFMPAGSETPVFAPYIEHVPPDPTSAIFWLKNRRSKEWRDRHEHTGADGGAITIVLDAKDSRA